MSLFCSIASVSAEDCVLTDNSTNSITNESSLEPSLPFEEDTNQNVNDSSDINANASATTTQNVNDSSDIKDNASATTTQKTAEKSKNTGRWM